MYRRPTSPIHAHTQVHVLYQCRCLHMPIYTCIDNLHPLYMHTHLYTYYISYMYMYRQPTFSIHAHTQIHALYQHMCLLISYIYIYMYRQPTSPIHAYTPAHILYMYMYGQPTSSIHAHTPYICMHRTTYALHACIHTSTCTMLTHVPTHSITHMYR